MMRGVTGLLLVVSGLGCGSGAKELPLQKTAPAKGVVQLNGKPLTDATVTFLPKGTNKAQECVGVTDNEGKYSLKQVHGGDGAPPGDYKVVVSRFVKPDGTPVKLSAGESPANLGAMESLPAAYSSFENTTLTATVPETGGEFKFELKGR